MYLPIAYLTAEVVWAKFVFSLVDNNSANLADADIVDTVDTCGCMYLVSDPPCRGQLDHDPWV